MIIKEGTPTITETQWDPPAKIRCIIGRSEYVGIMDFTYQYLVNIRTELCPPNPKELLIHVLIILSLL